MNPIASRTILSQSAKALGIELPKTLLAQFKDAAELQERAATAFPAGRIELTAAVMTELRAKRDPLDSAAVQRAALAHQISDANIGYAATLEGEDMIRTALLDHSDDILATWSQALDSDADDLTTAAERMGDVDLNEVSTIRAHPVAFGMARDAISRFDTARQGAQQLAGLRHVVVQPSTLYFLAAKDAPRLQDLKIQAGRRGDNYPSPYLLAINGIRPTFIHTVSELTERNQALAQHYQRERDAEEATRREFIRNHR